MDPATQTLTVIIPGDLTSTTAESVRQGMYKILDAQSTEWKFLHLNLSEAKMVDSVGLNLIVSILRMVQKGGRKMQVLCSNPNVHRTFLFTRLDRHLELIKV